MSFPNQSGNTRGELGRYNEFYIEILQPDSALGKSILGFIRLKLRQYDLQSHCDETEILLETYIRTVDYIAKGGKITNVSAWTKSVSFNIIRETARRKPKNQQIDSLILEDLISRHDSENDGDCQYLTEQMVKIRDAFKLLSLKEQLLIEQKVILNHSWTTIQELLQKEGHPPQSLTTLRKQKERAIGKLLKIYNSL